VEVPYLYWTMNRFGDVYGGPVFDAEYFIQQGAKPLRFDDKNLTVSFRPNILLGNIANGGVGPQIKMTPWLSTDQAVENGAWLQSSVDHYGITFGVAGAASGNATGTMLKVTKNTKNAAFYVAATGAASTGDSASGDVISIPSSGGRVFTFTATANAHIVYIGTTAYSVADAGTATQNATAIAAALNAGSQVGAESSTTTVTIWAKPNLPILPPVVWDVTGTAFVAVTTAAGDSTPLRVISGETVTAGADFDTDTLYEGETGYVALGTTGLNQGAIVTATNWGLKIAALREDFSHVTWKDYLKNSFVVHVRKGDADAGVTVTNSVKASSGIGTAELVLGMEYSSMVDNAIGTLPTYIPNEAPEMYASASGRYSLIDISYTNPIDSVIGYGGKTFYHVLFALELDGAANLPSGCQGDQLAETILTTGFTTADLDA